MRHVVASIDIRPYRTNVMLIFSPAPFCAGSDSHTIRNSICWGTLLMKRILAFAFILGGLLFAYRTFGPNVPHKAPDVASKVAGDEYYNLVSIGSDGAERVVRVKSSVLKQAMQKHPDGNLRVQLAVDKNGNIVLDKDGNPIVFDPATVPPCDWNPEHTICTIDTTKQYEPYYEIVAFHPDSTRTVLRRIKRSELPSAVGVMQPPGNQLFSVGLDGKQTTIGPPLQGVDALSIFAAGFLKYVYTTDENGKPDGKMQTTVSTVSSNGSLDVILVIDNAGNVVIDKDKNAIWFDPAAFKADGPLPEPGTKWMWLLVDRSGKLSLGNDSNVIPCGLSIGVAPLPQCKPFVARTNR
jgi:hypothetical protein